MNKIFEKFVMVKFDKVKATHLGHFQSTVRLPCAHMMYDWKEKSLYSESIHPQWRIDVRSFDACVGQKKWW